LFYQNERQADDMQRVTNNRITQHAIRHLSQLQRVHLQLHLLVGQDARATDKEQLDLQISLLWSALETVESPIYSVWWSPKALQLIATYRAEWEGMQPLLTEWRANSANSEVRAELLQQMEEADQVLFSLNLVVQAEFEKRLIDWGISTQSLNQAVRNVIVLFIILIATTIYLIYRFSQSQAKANEVLRHSEQRLRALLEMIPDLVCRVTRTGIYLDVKPPRSFVMPVDMEKMLGHSLEHLLPADIANGILQIIDRTLATQQEHFYEFPFFNEKDEQTHDYELRIIPSSDEEVLFIGRDITLLKQQAERTRHAQKLESLGVLAGGIAHDFNNLLTGMMGQISLAKMKLKKGLPITDNIEKAGISADRAADLTKQLLAYAGKGQFQLVPLDLNQLIRDMVGLMETATPHDANLTLDLAPELPLFKADRGQIQQLVMNLFMNAIEALENSPGRIAITTHLKEAIDQRERAQYTIDQLKEGPYIALEVTDDGCGMEPDILQRIFDPFFSTKSNSHGLGLSAMVGIIGTHHGGLYVQSWPGEGSTFTIIFSGVDIVKPVNVAPPLLVPVPNEQRSVLVVDDEAEVREVANEILTNHGYHVLLAESGPQGIEQFSQHQSTIGLILLDVRMPGMDGKQTYIKLRQIDPTVKIMFVSGYSETDLNTQLTDQQEIAFLAKPYTADRLIHAVQTISSS